jgi:hypothetical protein
MKIRVKIDNGLTVVADIPFIKETGSRKEIEKKFNNYKENNPYMKIDCIGINGIPTHPEFRKLKFINVLTNPGSPRKEY